MRMPACGSCPMTMTVLPSRPPSDSSSAPTVWSTMPCWSVVTLSTNASVGSVAASIAKIGISASLAAVTIDWIDASSV